MFVVDRRFCRFYVYLILQIVSISDFNGFVDNDSRGEGTLQCHSSADCVRTERASERSPVHAYTSGRVSLC